MIRYVVCERRIFWIYVLACYRQELGESPKSLFDMSSWLCLGIPKSNAGGSQVSCTHSLLCLYLWLAVIPQGALVCLHDTGRRVPFVSLVFFRWCDGDAGSCWNFVCTLPSVERTPDHRCQGGIYRVCIVDNPSVYMWQLGHRRKEVKIWMIQPGVSMVIFDHHSLGELCSLVRLGLSSLSSVSNKSLALLMGLTSWNGMVLDEPAPIP